MKISFKLNGKMVTVDTDPAKRLLDVLRYDLGITSVKEGCGEGECGACSVYFNSRLVNSCLIPVAMVDGEEVVTIDGIKDTEVFKKLEDSFQEVSAVQCGFCFPGMAMASIKILEKNKNPSDEEIKEGLSGNLCRCTGYQKIIEGVKLTAKKLNND